MLKAAGAIEGYATPVIGPGLISHPNLDEEMLALDKESARTIQLELRRVVARWEPFDYHSCSPSKRAACLSRLSQPLEKGNI